MPDDRIDLRLYNTIIIFDVYTIGRTAEEARATLLAAIAAGDAKPTEMVARELTARGSVRESWVDQPPYIASDVTEEEYKDLKGITTAEAFDRFYVRK